MRLSAPIEKKGYFWLPNDPEDIFPGVLMISKEGSVKLELMVLVKFPEVRVKQPWTFRSDDNISFDKIVGRFKGDKFVTLGQCESLTRISTLQASVNGPVSLQSSKFIAQYAIIGKNYFGEKEDICFSYCIASFEGLEELLDTRSIDTDIDLLYKSISMKYNRPDPVSFKIPYNSDEVELTLNFCPSDISFPIRNKFSLKQRTYISLSSNKPLSFDSCRSLIWRINNFLCLAIDKPVSFASATVFSKEKLEFIGDEKQETPMSLYFVGNSHPEIETDISLPKMLFFFNELKEFVNALSCWMKNYEKHDIPINMYFGSVHGEGHIEPKFLSLAQGIEVLHRQLSNSKKDKKLYVRIMEMTEEFKDDFFANDTERKIFAQNVKNERNWLTHYDRASSPFIKEGNIRGFIELNWKLEALFQLHLMKLAGMKLERIKEIVGSNHHLRYKLALLPDKEKA